MGAVRVVDRLADIEGANGVQVGHDGSAATPAYSWSEDPNTGMYRPGADQIALACGGGTPLSMTPTQVNLNRNTVLTNGSGTELLFSGDLQTDIKSDDSMFIDFDRDADGGGAKVFEVRAGGVTRLKIHDTPLVIQQGGDSDTPSTWQYKAADALADAVGSDLLLKAGQSAGTDKAGASLHVGGGQPTGSGASGPILFEAAAPGVSGTTVRSLVERARIDSAGLRIADGHALIAGSSSGLKIGTATEQKLGWWNATPVAQPVLATGTGATVDQVIGLLQTLGFCRQS